MLAKQQKIIDIIQNFVSKDFGITQAYYGFDENNLELLFIIKQEYGAVVMSYLTSLTDILKRNIGVAVSCSVYIEDNNKKENLEEVVKGEKLQQIILKNESVLMGASV